MYEISLIGGRFDGMTIPVPEKAWYGATVFFASPSEPLNPATKVTSDGWEGHFYYPDDFRPGGHLEGEAQIEDESVYHKCADLFWRPWKLKSALEL